MPGDQLNSADVALVRESWLAIKPDWLKVGAEYFIRLFVKYPDVKAFFHSFDGEDDMDKIRVSKKLRAHLINFGHGLGSMFENLEDMELLEIVAQNLAANHWRRGIAANYFETAFKEFVTMLSENSDNSKELLEAWEKVLAVIANIFKESMEELDKEKK